MLQVLLQQKVQQYQTMLHPMLRGKLLIG